MPNPPFPSSPFIRTEPSQALKRALGLIQQASSPVVEEARTSAFQACRIIRENKLQLSDPTREQSNAYEVDVNYGYPWQQRHWGTYANTDTEQVKKNVEDFRREYVGEWGDEDYTFRRKPSETDAAFQARIRRESNVGDRRRVEVDENHFRTLEQQRWERDQRNKQWEEEQRRKDAAGRSTVPYPKGSVKR